MNEAVLAVGDGHVGQLARLLARAGLELRSVAPGAPIPGSYWGEPEAGLVASAVWCRDDTPVHSVLHEACHALCMDSARRRGLDRDAGGDDAEECAVCLLQLVYAEELEGVGRERLLEDMDRWGYSFRLGSARAWYESESADARAWLFRHGLIDAAGRGTLRARP